MLEELRLLVELQEVDSMVHELEKNKARLPRLVEYAREDLRAVEAETETAQAAFDELSREKRAADTEMQAENEHLRKLKLRSTEIKTNKEYFAHLKEIEDCQKKVGRIEESALLLMENIEKAEAGLGQKKKALEEERERFEASRKEIEKSFEEGDARLFELARKRGELLPKVPREVAEYYAAMLKLYPDSAVVQAANGSCTGCRMVMPPQVYNNVRKGESIVKCNNCRRILYYKGGVS